MTEMPETVGDHPFLPPTKTPAGHVLPWRGYPLSDVLPILLRIAGNHFAEWTWSKNTQCKYVDIRIDTRDGGFVTLRDRDGNLMRIEDVAYQYEDAGK